ncbi:hypothetical protein BS47DRAFT_1396247 [Hydnum rufescens UP504]|uniref:DUF6532 domain-containing protein n=1 Tax=Hydnum rufescens UP504 TaxID=1448309 RepID=A0A9P6DQM3_9AGAM|nr:hypothetical protein BS47DRAFT_1396247 [Hydnum rufescens UP504]
MKRRAEEDEQHCHEDIEIAAASLKLAPMAQRAPRVAHTSSSSHHLKKEKMVFKSFLINPDEPNVAGEQEMKQGNDPTEISSTEVMSDDSSRVDLSLTGVNIDIENATSDINSSDDEIFSEAMDNHSRLSPPDLDMHSSAYNSDRIDLVDDHGNSANNGTSLGKDASPESEGGYGLELIGRPLPKCASEFDSDNADTEHLTVKKPHLRTLELLKSSKVHLSLPPTAQTHLHKKIQGRLQVAHTGMNPLSSDSSLSQSATPANTEYIITKQDHQLMCKATKSLYCLALLISNPWASMSEQDMLVNNAFAIACHENPSIPSFKKSAEFHKNIMASHSRFRNHFKQAAQKLVPSFYGLVNVPQKDVKDKVALTLAKGNYCAKTFGKTCSGLYEHPCISAVLNEAYFSNDKSEGAIHFKSFLPRMPVSALCLAVIAIKAVLTELEDGQSVPAEFSAKAWSKHYDSEVDSWNLWAMKDTAHIQTSHNVLMALTKLAG